MSSRRKRVLWILVALFGLQQVVGWVAGTMLCSRSMKSVTTYVEMYATDNSGRYPKRLAFHHRCPVCLTAYQYSSTAMPDSYKLRCTGWHFGMAGFRQGYPHYSSMDGWCMAPDHFTHQTPEEYLWLNDRPKL